MLARVLLHVVDAPSPVDHTAHRAGLHRRSCVVDHLFFGVGHFNDRHTAQRP
jgi:hypothetical protein